MPLLFIQNFPPTPADTRHFQPNVSLYSSPILSSLQPVTDSVSRGDLYVTDSLLYFYSQQTNNGFSLDYPSIGIHAIARLSDNYAPAPYIYCQLEQPQDSSLLELRFVPEDKESVDAIFQALCECASLHPDTVPDDDECNEDLFDRYHSRFDCNAGEEEEKEGQFDDEQEALDENGLNVSGRRTLERLESMLVQGEEGTAKETTADFEQR